ncbi:Meiotically up-regulated protein 86 protein [Coemansia thaxteri]|uniref:Meiotically up-regulated protein 86 protein n=1 Tax=Coemansia thaxteri TaxID=2663907 RepID=A0A9W8BLP2_9FUNG|nr:Meiotically up-regulated protein 86 protein [Coemansia thaxteri]KAJ2009201.1 Meiotically up-regulated protein 86 protein [Coemansia thaxteri]KAJ2473065.1 Meiotically up-regulated protein 86 protein [Coemansia sp. RSA 2322]KAJ2486465.1 Meiotically up-regulated protein 86 protein [Coemansia sp. RSA 2320]
MSEEANHPISSPADQGYKAEEPRFRPFANPGGPGWAALGVSLFTFSFYAGAIGMPFEDPNVATLASTSMIIGGMVVFISGMWAFAANDTVHATIFTLYGSLFGAIGYLSVLGFNVYNTIDQDKTVSHAAGTFWLAWMLITLVIMLSTVRYSAGTTAFMAFLFVSFVILAGGTWTGRKAAVKAGGWFSFFASLTSIYNTFAVIHKVGYSPLNGLPSVTKRFQRKTHRDEDSAAANV